MNWALADYDFTEFTYPYNQVFQVQSRGIGESCLIYICGIGVHFCCLCLVVVVVLFALCFWWLLFGEEGGGVVVVWGVGGEVGVTLFCVCTSL